MIEFVDKHDLWLILALNIGIIGWFYFKIIRPRYLELPQLKNLFHTKKEINERLKSAVSKDQFQDFKDLVIEMKRDLKEDITELKEKIDKLLMRER